MSFADPYTHADLERSRRNHLTGVLLTVQQIDDLLHEHKNADEDALNEAYEDGLANASCDCDCHTAKPERDSA